MPDDSPTLPDVTEEQLESLRKGTYPGGLPRVLALRIARLREDAAASGGDVSLAAACRAFAESLSPLREV